LQQQKPTELVESGCDYITATTGAGRSSEQLYGFGRWLVSVEVKNGCKERLTRAGGYHTVTAGSAQIGRRGDGVCLRASSSVAREHWNQIVDLSENVTRFDIQATDKGELTPAERMAKLWQANPGWTKGKGRRSEVKKMVGPSGTEILRIGSRSSERYLRIYDKWLETNDPWYLNCLRFELEMKGELANNFAVQLTAMEDPDSAMRATLLSYCDRKLSKLQSAGYLRWPAGNEITCSGSPRPAQECIRTLRYLTQSVQPCVRRLVDAGLVHEVYEALGLPDAKHND